MKQTPSHDAAIADRCCFCGEPKNDHAVMSAEVCVLTTCESAGVLEALREYDDGE